MLRCSGDFKETANNKEKGGTKGAAERTEGIQDCIATELNFIFQVWADYVF